ncbi:HEPN family nuclease [Candidatus Mycalebacterium sp.]
MEYGKFPEEEFISRTLEIIDKYGNPEKNEHEVTLSVHCLIGMTILCKENRTFFEKMPTDFLDDFISTEKISLEIRQLKKEDPCPCSLRGLVFHLRHAVAHLQGVKSKEQEGKIEGVVFCHKYPKNNSPKNDLDITIKANEIPGLVTDIGKCALGQD